MKIERTNNTIRNMKWGYINRIINIILPFIFRTVMIKVLGAEYLGINSLFVSILQVLSLSELGFGSAMVYSMYKPIAEDDNDTLCALLNFYKRVYSVIGCIIMGVGLILVPFIPHMISGTYPDTINIYIVYIIFLLNTAVSYFLFAYKGALINAFQRNDIESKISTIISLFRYGLEIIVIYMTKQYYYYLFVGLAATLLNNLLKLWYTNRVFPELKCRGILGTKYKNEIKSNVLALMCHKIGGTILNSADNIVLSAFMGVVVVANYSNYYYVMNAVEAIVIVCFTGMTAGIGNSFATETVEKNRTDFKHVLFFNAWIVAWCCVCFICLYQDFMQLWVGKKYMLSNGIVLLIVLYFFIHCIRRTIIVFRDGAGMWQDNKWQPICSACFNLIVNVILVQIIGLEGVLISSILSMVLIDNPWEAFAFCKKIKVKPREYFMMIVRYFSLTVFITSITYCLCLLINSGLIINLLIKGSICVIVPNIILLVVFRRNSNYIFFRNLLLIRKDRRS